MVETDAPALARPAAVNPFELDPSEIRPLRQIEREARACTDCALHRGRAKVVFGSGSPDADLLIVGVGPGRHEDLQGKPFVGATGNLVDNALAEAGLHRDDCYLTHLVKCHGDDGRAPTRDEVAACSRYLVEQIAAVRPRVIVALGGFVTQVLLRRPIPIERVAGFRLDVFDGVTLIPTLHPTAALRGNPGAVTALKRDLRTAKAVLDGRLATGAEARQIAKRQTDRS